MVDTFTSEFTVGESITTDPIPESDFIPNSGNLFPKFPDQIRKTAVEVWLFDAIAEDGSSAITISFFRDALAAPAGFRIAVNASWSDGTIWGKPLIFPKSLITSKGPDVGSGAVTGVWRTDEDRSSHATFEVAADLSTAKVTFDVPGKVVGTLELKSLGFHPLPKSAREAEAAPSIYWMRSIAKAAATVDMVFTSPSADGESTTERPLVIGKDENPAFGGVDRSWESVGWTQAVTDSVFLRAKSGPYDLHFMLLVGKAEQDYRLTASASLYRDGELVCAPHDVLHHTEDGITTGAATTTTGGDVDTLVVKKLFGGEGLPAPFRHQNVGYQLEYTSGGPDGKTWVFETRHQRAWYRKPTGPDTGSSGFIVSVTGGEAGKGKSFQGWGYEGQVVLPE